MLRSSHVAHFDALECRRLLAATTFTVDSSLSSLKVEVGYNLPVVGRGTLVPQAAGLDVAKYAGTIKTDLTATSIKFTGGSAIDAVAKAGSFSPGGTAADYALKATHPFLGTLISAAIRDFKFDATSGVLGLTTGGSFAANTISAKGTGGTLAYASSFAGNGSSSLVSSSGTNQIATGASVIKSGSTYTLTIPITATFATSFGGAAGTLKLTGKLVAKAGAVTPVAGSIAGNVFNDANANARKDTGETNLASWAVYIDKDNDNILDTGETFTRTDSSGNYKLSNLAAGSYAVKVVKQAGFRQTLPSSSGINVAVSSGQIVTGKSFGFTRRASLSGIAYKDTNGNGRRDSGEGIFSGVRVYLDSNGNGRYDTSEVSALTDSAGKYTFNVLAGSHKIREVAPAGFKLSQPSTGLYSVTVVSGQVSTGYNFGNKAI